MIWQIGAKVGWERIIDLRCRRLGGSRRGTPPWHPPVGPSSSGGVNCVEEALKVVA